MTEREFRTLALALPGAAEKPHFDRTAFYVARTFATLGPDGAYANLKLTPDEQALAIEMAPDAYAPVPGKWGEQGWTTVSLGAVSKPVLAEILRTAWLHAQPKPRLSKPRLSKPRPSKPRQAMPKKAKQ